MGPHEIFLGLIGHKMRCWLSIHSIVNGVENFTTKDGDLDVLIFLTNGVSTKFLYIFYALPIHFLFLR